MTIKPRAFTKDECRSAFLNHIHALASYWGGNIGEEATVHARLEGLAFSILVVLDGESGLPGFHVVPAPHAEDKQFFIDDGKNWWPNDVDIAGELHEYFCKKDD